MARLAQTDTGDTLTQRLNLSFSPRTTTATNHRKCIWSSWDLHRAANMQWPGSSCCVVIEAWPSLSIIVICPRGLAGKFSECRICQQWSPLVWIELGSAVIWHGILLTTSVIFCSDFHYFCLNIAFCIMVTVCLQIWFPSWTKFIMFGLGIQSPLVL